jgi:cytochrome c biogenesis protein CcdA
MVGTICPMVHGARTIIERHRTLLMYSCGSLVGAALTGAMAASCGSLFFSRFPQYRRVSAIVLAAVSLLYLFDEFKILKLPHPQSPLRVPANWRFFGHDLGLALYGLVLGMGVWTAIPFSILYVVIGWCSVIGSPILGAIAFVGFGLGRTLPIVILTKLEKLGRASEIVESACWNVSLISFANKCALTFAGSSLLLMAVLS